MQSIQMRYINTIKAALYYIMRITNGLKVELTKIKYMSTGKKYINNL
jgi:hypothetical protein